MSSLEDKLRGWTGPLAFAVSNDRNSRITERLSPARIGFQ